MKSRVTTIWILCLTAIMTSGCVWKSKYEDAVADLEGAKAEIESIRAEQQRLSQQVKTLESLTQEITREAEVASARLQQAKDDAEAARKAAHARIAKLDQTISQLTTQQNNLRHAIERAKNDQSALEVSVEKYQSELAEAERLRMQSFPPPVEQLNQPAGTAPEPPTQAQAPADLTPVPPAPPPPSADTTPVTPRPVATKPVEPPDEGFFSALKGWLLSLWHSVFS